MGCLGCECVVFTLELMRIEEGCSDQQVVSTEYYVYMLINSMSALKSF